MTDGKRMNDNMNNDLKSTDIDWLAVQYLTGDLTEDAAARFETCLAGDQAAREALSRAVELALAVSVVESTARDVTPRDATCSPSSRTPVAWTVPAVWLSVAALVLVAVLAFRNSPAPFSPGNRTDRSVNVKNLSALDPGELAALWANTSEPLVTAGLAFEDESFDVLIDDESLDPLGGSTAADDMEIHRLQAPSWMIAALAGSGGSADAEMQE